MGNKIKYTLLNKDILINESSISIIDKHKWQLLKSSNKTKETYYFISQINRKSIYLHRLIANAKNGDVIDHKDGNWMNLTNDNLIKTTQQKNCFNRRRRKNYGYKGVYFVKNKWTSQIGFNGKTIHLGRFKNEIEAAKAYDAKAKELFGEFAKLNFP